MTNLAVPDFHDFANAISGSPMTVPGHVSFDVEWSGNGDHSTIRDETFGFAGAYVGGSTTIAFSVSDDGAGVVYTTDPDGQVTIGSGVGRERNGIFFA